MTTPAALVMNSVRERVRRQITTPVLDCDALSLCLACATFETEALLELSHQRMVCAEALDRCDDLALTADEFDALLCDASVAGPRRTQLAVALAAEEDDGECKKRHIAIAKAMPLTLKEKEPQHLWKESARARARVSLAMIRKEGHAQCLETALGSVLVSDHRRIEDLRAQTEEEGIDLIGVSALISAVSRALTG